MADNLQDSIKRACLFFYGNFEDERQVKDRIAEGNTIKSLQWHDLSMSLAMGIGFLIAKGFLTYRGDQRYSITLAGYRYFKSRLENGDIVL